MTTIAFITDATTYESAMMCDVMLYQSILVEMRHQKIWQSNFSFRHCSLTTKLRLRKTVPISENFAIFRKAQFSSDGFDVSILYFR